MQTVACGSNGYTASVESIYERDHETCTERGCGERPVSTRIGMCVDHCRASGMGMVRPDVRRPDVKSSGVVYFMLAGGLLKIGFTTDLKRRANELKAERVLAYFPGDRLLERSAFNAFAKWHVHGEYFRAEPEALAMVERLTRTPSPTP